MASSGDGPNMLPPVSMDRVSIARFLPRIVGLLIVWTAIAVTRTAAAQGGPGTPTALRTPIVLFFPAEPGGLPAYTDQPLTRAELYDFKTGKFTPTGSMSGPTRDFTATLLENGKVLITGGENQADHTPLAGAELYDPGTGKFSAAGRMNMARTEHTATLLADGKVLIAGGWTVYDEKSLHCEELYDPQTGKFTLTGELTDSRDSAAAILLRSGKVLIAGGSEDEERNHHVEQAELYDPGKGSFTSTGTMRAPRDYGSAVMLRDGRIFIVGGYPSNTMAELYDPKAGTFTLAESFGGPNRASTVSDDCIATALQNGKVLITGCELNPTGEGINAIAQLYDPVADKFTRTGSMITARSSNTSTLLADGRVLVTGGSGIDPNTPVEAGDSLASAELYDPAAGAFTPTGSMTVSRTLHKAVRLRDGKVLIVGGASITILPASHAHSSQSPIPQ